VRIRDVRTGEVTDHVSAWSAASQPVPVGKGRFAFSGINGDRHAIVVMRTDGTEEAIRPISTEGRTWYRWQPATLTEFGNGIVSVLSIGDSFRQLRIEYHNLADGSAVRTQLDTGGFIRPTYAIQVGDKVAVGGLDTLLVIDPVAGRVVRATPDICLHVDRFVSVPGALLMKCQGAWLVYGAKER